MLKTSDDLLNMQKNLLEKSLIIIKFTADWCVPCKNI